MSNTQKKLLAGLIVVIVIYIGIFSLRWHGNSKKLVCNCKFPNSGKLGIIEQGKCIVKKCQVPNQKRDGANDVSDE